MDRFRIHASAVVTYILVILFGSSSWISVNGTWIQLPLMVNVLPEGWALPSYLTVIVQLAFVGPLIYAIAKQLIPYLAKRSARLRSFTPSICGQNLTPTPLIYGSLILAVVCQLLLAIFWQRTSVWSDGVLHSTALFTLFFFISLVNCLSNVLYLPYMFRFRPTYTTAYFVGMGFSALVPSVLGLIQGSGRVDCIVKRKVDNDSSAINETVVTAVPVLPLFGVNVFYGVLSFWLSVVVVGFYFLNRLPQLQAERNVDAREEVEGMVKEPTRHVDEDATPEVGEGGQLGGGNTEGTACGSADEVPSHEAHRRQEDTVSPLLYFYLLMVTAWVCALMNGVLPSVQSFATLPYGQMTYHLAVTISNLANPVACFVPFFVRVRRVGLVVTMWTVVGTVLAAYILTTAAWSPKPLMGKETNSAGPVFSVLSWTLVTGVLAYLRTLIAGALRESGGAGSESRLFWCGLFTQGGAFLGAMVMFPLVNMWHAFQSAPSCAP